MKLNELNTLSYLKQKEQTPTKFSDNLNPVSFIGLWMLAYGALLVDVIHFTIGLDKPIPTHDVFLPSIGTVLSIPTSLVIAKGAESGLQKIYRRVRHSISR